jgi:outer membrane protein OmpA-like peptidoglycan-associated protein
MSDVQEQSGRNYGLSYSLRKDFWEFFGFRVKADHLVINGDNRFRQAITKTNINSISGEFIIIPFPCWPVVPYIIMGGGGSHFYISQPSDGDIDKNNFVPKANGGLGIELLNFDPVMIKAEAQYNHTLTDDLDGAAGYDDNKNDSYITANLGVNIYVFKGDVTDFCNPKPEGVREAPKPQYEINRDYYSADFLKEGIIPSSPAMFTFEDIKIPDGKMWTLSDIYFDYDKSILRPEAFGILKYTLYILESHPNISLEIAGYSDASGNKKHNVLLSQERADAVKNYLIEHGISADRLTSIGYGSKNPIGSNKTPEGRKLNRRIELKIVKE